MNVISFKCHRGRNTITRGQRGINESAKENDTHLQLSCSSNILLHIFIAVETRTDGHGIAIIGIRKTGTVGDFKLVVFASEDTDLQRGETSYAETVLLKEWNKVLLDLLANKKVVLGLFNLSV